MTLRDLFNGAYDNWQGLTPDLAVRRLEQDLQPISAARGPEEQPRANQRFLVIHYSRPTSPKEIDVWSAIGQAFVRVVEYADPPMADLEGTLARYGAPDVLLADQRYAAGMRVWDHIYAARGITFAVGEPYPPAAPAPRRAVFLQIYPAGSVQFYMTEIGSGAATRPNTP
jgi:hypothetical protein